MGDSTTLRPFAERAFAIMGCSVDWSLEPPSTDFDRCWFTLASSLRLKMVECSPDTRTKVLALAYLLSRQFFAAAPARFSLQGLSKITNGQFDKFLLLAAERKDYEPLLNDSGQGLAVPPFNNAEFVLAVSVFQYLLRENTDMLTALERAIPTTFSVADRSAFLVQTGRMMRLESQEKPVGGGDIAG